MSASSASAGKHGSQRRGKPLKSIKKPAIRKKTRGVAVSFPKSASEVSKNWKELCKKLGMNPTPKHARGNKLQERLEQRKATKLEIPGKISASRKAKGSSTGVASATAATAAKPDIWFDDVDPALVARCEQKTPSCSTSSSTMTGDNDRSESISSGSLITGPDVDVGKSLAIDCEFVGVGPGGTESVLARCSLVNHHGFCVYDKFVQPREQVTDYRTFVSGVRPRDLRGATPFTVVQKEVADLVLGRILVGHAISNDLKVLFLSHPRSLIRDTSKYKPFKALNQGRTPGLKKLSQQILNIDIQSGEHSSVEDAQATMKLYRLHRKAWEASLKKATKLKVHRQKKKAPSED